MTEEEEIAEIRSGAAQKRGVAEFMARQQAEAQNAATRGKKNKGAFEDQQRQLADSEAQARGQFANNPAMLAALDAADRPSPIMAAIGGAFGKAKDTLFPPKPLPPPPVPQPINPAEIAEEKKSPIMRMLAAR